MGAPCFIRSSQVSDLSCTCDPNQSYWQCWIFNPLCWAGDRTCIPMLPRHCRFCCGTGGTQHICSLAWGWTALSMCEVAWRYDRKPFAAGLRNQKTKPQSGPSTRNAKVEFWKGEIPERVAQIMSVFCLSLWLCPDSHLCKADLKHLKWGQQE